MPKETAYYNLDVISGKHDVKELKKTIGSVPGIISVSVNAEKDSLAVDFDSTGIDGELIEKKLDQLGYKIKSDNFEEHVM